ncbi:MAG: hypothetical protein ABIC95_01945 [archaeon]
MGRFSIILLCCCLVFAVGLLSISAIAIPPPPPAPDFNIGSPTDGDNTSDGNESGSPPAETCDDGIQNQGEEDVDCGGPCILCIQRPDDNNESDPFDDLLDPDDDQNDTGWFPPADDGADDGDPLDLDSILGASGGGDMGDGSGSTDPGIQSAPRDGVPGADPLMAGDPVPEADLVTEEPGSAARKIPASTSGTVSPAEIQPSVHGLNAADIRTPAMNVGIARGT